MTTDAYVLNDRLRALSGPLPLPVTVDGLREAYRRRTALETLLEQTTGLLWGNGRREVRKQIGRCIRYLRTIEV